MNAEEYKSICNGPDAFARGVIEASERVLSQRHPPSALRLREILSSSPITKPLLHSGGDHTDYFLVEFDAAEAEEIVEYLLDAEAAAVGSDGETTPQASHFGSLVDVWTRYVDSCEGVLESRETLVVKPNLM